MVTIYELDQQGIDLVRHEAQDGLIQGLYDRKVEKGEVRLKGSHAGIKYGSRCGFLKICSA